MEEKIKAFWENLENEALEQAKALSSEIIKEHPDYPTGYYLQGHYHYSQGDLKQAIEYFQQAVKLQKGAITVKSYAYYWMGLIYSKYSLPGDDEFKRNPFYDRDKAIEFFKRALDYEEFPVNTINQLYNYCRLSPEEGLRIVKKGLKNYPNEISYKFLKIDIFYSVYKDSAKVRSLTLNLIDPGNSETFPAVILYLGSHKTGEAVQNLEAIEKILSELEKDDYLGPLISYQYARIFFDDEDKRDRLINLFQKALTDGYGDTALYSLYALVYIYFRDQDYPNMNGLIEDLDLTKIENVFDGPRFNYLGEIHFYPDPSGNLQDLYHDLHGIKYEGSERLKGKWNFLLGILAWDLNKYDKCFDHLSDAFNSLQLKEIIGYQNSSLFQWYDAKKDNKQILKKITKKIIKECRKSSKFKAEFKSENLESLIDILHDTQCYEEVCLLCGLFDLSDYDADYYFNYAYASVECGKKDLAFEIYHQYLDRFGDSSAVLNNLANIYKQAGKRAKAVELYEKAIRIDPENTIARKNLDKLNEEDVQKEKQKEYEASQHHFLKIAAEDLKKENNYVIGKIRTFITSWSQDPRFNGSTGPIPNFAFAKYFQASKERAQSLRQQMLDKQYLVLTEKRDEYQARIYEINPFLVEVLKKVEKEISRVVDNAWETNFQKITSTVLDDLDYFDTIEKISRINKKYSGLLVRDFKSLTLNYLMKQPKAVVVLSGSMIELALIYYFERKKVEKIEYVDSRTAKNIKKSIYKANLIDLISYTIDKSLFGTDFTHLSNLLRVYRNYIHPGMELRPMSTDLDMQKAEVSFFGSVELLKRIIK